MNTRILTFFVLLVVGILQLHAQEAVDNKWVKERFDNADAFLFEDNYKEALPFLLEIYAKAPENYNVRFLIGLCYLNLPLEKQKSISFLETASEHISKNYKEGNSRELNAPPVSRVYLGDAYHINYKFDKALDIYYECISKNILDSLIGKADVNRRIEICLNAIAIVKDTVDVKVSNIGKEINTEYPEYSPVVSSDESVMIFTSRRPKNLLDKKSLDGKFYESIYISKNVKGKWSKPSPLFSKGSSNHQACIGLSPDGSTLLIYKDDNGDGNIYMSKKLDENWTTPEKLGPTINTKYWETSASISSDGTTLYFTSNRPGGIGGRDIYSSHKLPNGDWAEAQLLDTAINTIYDEGAPYIHPDGKTLFFCSKGHKTMGGYDVFYSIRDENGIWSEPVNLGFPVNTTGDDAFYIPSLNRKRAYYSSYQKDGFGEKDIYLLQLPETKKVNYTIVKGLVKAEVNERLPSNVKITLKDSKTKKILGVYKPNAITGKYLQILEEDKSYDVIVEADNVLTFEGKISVFKDSIDNKLGNAFFEALQPKAYQSKTEYDTIYSEINSTIILKRIEDQELLLLSDNLFSKNSDNLSMAGKARLAELSKRLKKNEFSILLAEYGLVRDKDLESEIHFLRRTQNITNYLIKTQKIDDNQFAFKDTKYKAGEQYIDIKIPKATVITNKYEANINDLLEEEQNKLTIKSIAPSEIKGYNDSISNLALLSNYNNLASGTIALHPGIQNSGHIKHNESANSTQVANNRTKAKNENVQNSNDEDQVVSAHNQEAYKLKLAEIIKKEKHEEALAKAKNEYYAQSHADIKDLHADLRDLNTDIKDTHSTTKQSRSSSKEQRLEANESRSSSKEREDDYEQRSSTKEQRVEPKEHRLSAKEQRAEAKEQLAETKELVRTMRDLEKLTPEKVAPERKQSQMRDYELLATLYFSESKTGIRATERPKLDTIVKLCQQHKGVNFRLAGHADSRGTEEFNLTISKTRSDQILNYLVQSGIYMNKIHVYSFGSLEPIAPNYNEDGTNYEEGQQQNRRVEIWVDKLTPNQIKYINENNLRTYLNKELKPAPKPKSGKQETKDLKVALLEAKLAEKEAQVALLQAKLEANENKKYENKQNDIKPREKTQKQIAKERKLEAEEKKKMEKADAALELQNKVAVNEIKAKLKENNAKIKEAKPIVKEEKIVEKQDTVTEKPRVKPQITTRPTLNPSYFWMMNRR